MTSNQLTPADIIAIHAKANGNPILSLNAAATSTSNNNKNQTYYIPFSTCSISGKSMPLKLKFTRQVLCSKAKLPYGVEADEARDVRVMFRKISSTDLEGTEYKAEQYESLINSNNEFIKALDIIADEYMKLVENEVLTYEGKNFNLNKNRTINCFRQSERDANKAAGEKGDANGKVRFENPMFRIKIPLDPKSKKLGTYSEKNGHRYIVFDTKRASIEAREKNLKVPQLVPARIKTADGYRDLDVHNADHFITYMSLTGGTINFDSVCISKSGISLMCRFDELHVWRHKPLKVNAMSESDIADMARDGPGGDEDDTFETDEPVEESNKPSGNSSSKKQNKSNDNSKRQFSKALDNDDEEVDLDDPVEDEPESDASDGSSSSGKKPSNVNTPSKHNKQVKSDSDEEPEANDDSDEEDDAPPPPPKKAVKTAATSGSSSSRKKRSD